MKLKIDGLDIAEYGVYLLEGAYKEVFRYPSAKTIKANDWYEYDGRELDLPDTTLLKGRELDLPFKVVGDQNSYEMFLGQFDTDVYHTFYFAELNISLSLRLLSSGELNQGFFNLRFAEDSFSYYSVLPTQDITNDSPWYIGTIRISRWNVKVLNSADILRAVAPVKEGLKRDIPSQNGNIYDSSSLLKRKNKDITLKLLLRTSTAQNMVVSWKSLISYLIQNPKTITSDEMEQTYPFVYKSCTIKEASLGAKPWLEMDLNIELYESNRVTEVGNYLSSEEINLIQTEDGNLIDLNI